MRSRTLNIPKTGEQNVACLRWGAVQFKARTEVSDGQHASTHAARSAGFGFAVLVLSIAVDVGRDHLIHRKRSPFPYEGKALTPLKLRRDCKCRARHFPYRGERSVAALPGGAKPFAGWGGLEGFTPPHRFKARTAASDGHCAFTRAARSAGLRFAVRSLSEVTDSGNSQVRGPGWHLIHR